MNENQELFRNKNKKEYKFKIETPKYFWINEFICLRSKAYSIKCEDDDKSKLKGFSKSQWKLLIFKEINNA